MIPILFLLATGVSLATSPAGHHVPVSIKSIHDSITTRACSRAYFAGEAPYIVLDIESTDDPTSITLSIRGVNTLTSSLLTPIGIVIKSQAAVDALVKSEPVTFSYFTTDGKDSLTVSFPSDSDLNCK